MFYIFTPSTGPPNESLPLQPQKSTSSKRDLKSLTNDILNEETSRREKHEVSKEKKKKKKTKERKDFEKPEEKPKKKKKRKRDTDESSSSDDSDHETPKKKRKKKKDRDPSPPAPPQPPKPGDGNGHSSKKSKKKKKRHSSEQLRDGSRNYTPMVSLNMSAKMELYTPSPPVSPRPSLNTPPAHCTGFFGGIKSAPNSDYSGTLSPIREGAGRELSTPVVSGCYGFANDHDLETEMMGGEFTVGIVEDSK